MGELSSKSRLLKDEIESIVLGGVNKTASPDFDLILHTPYTDIYPLKIISMDIHRNFNNNLADIINVEFIVLRGDFIKAIKPLQDRLEISIEITNMGVFFEDLLTFRLSETNTELENNDLNNFSLEDLNKEGVVVVRGQCLNKLYDYMRLQTISNVFGNTNVTSVINKVIGDMLINYGKENDNIDKRTIKMVKSLNTRKYTQVVIDRGTSAINIPMFLQDTNYGVYNGGIGLYVFKNHKEESIYIYPLFSGGSYEYDEELIIINVDGGISENYDTTHAYNENVLNIIASPFNDTVIKDNANIKRTGTGIIGVNSDSIVDGIVGAEDDVYTKRLKHKSLEDGIDGVIDVGVTNNFYKHRSKVLSSDGNYLSFKWVSSNGNLLKPGMPVVIMEEVNEEIVERSGTLHGVSIIYDKESKKESSILLIFIK